ncbi:Beta-barrel assembly machine subunit BamF [Pontibaca methylaminivorans]|uniref:Beta-barrel assembly machine subunit BamF n=2 Tax=Pontibaca methylaminivorans TaxID=515897 RepID=A0A1R3WY46_9RHOB|nr:Beta-barrel assembly machine subunit BamF [Pontibaca methylaminivorans]
MRRPLGAIILTTVLGAGGLVTGACSDGNLRDLRSSSEGPEEFAVMPVKPLVMPQNLSALPPPAPGQPNLADTNPVGEAVDSLGGSSGALNPTGPVPASDAALVARASRYGVPEGIRATLAAEDEAFRRQQARWSGFRLFPVDRYEQAYRNQALDPFSVTRQARAGGLATPSSPPEKKQTRK